MKMLCLSLFAMLTAHSASAITPEEKLASLGLSLPPASAPVANYVPAVRVNSLIFLAGHLPRDEAGHVITGRLGANLDDAAGAAAARQATLALLATLKAEIGDLSKVKRIVRVGGFVNSTPEFSHQPQVLNGCSDLLVAVFGDRGKHARSAVGVSSLPLGAAVEIELIAETE
jgi:enamine deaminase RidA (YjgF/YER057c/UK114 family)